MDCWLLKPLSKQTTARSNDMNFVFTSLFSQGNNGLAAKRLFELMTEGPPIAAVLGPTLSYELTVVGQITPFYNVLQVSNRMNMELSLQIKSDNDSCSLNVLDKPGPSQFLMSFNFLKS